MMDWTKSSNRTFLSVTVLIFAFAQFLALPAASVWAAPAGPDAAVTAQEQTLSTPELIDQALAAGRISADQRLLYLAFAVYQPESLPVEYQSNVGWYGTHVVAEVQQAWQEAKLQPQVNASAVINELNQMLPAAAGTVCDQPDGPDNDSTSPTFYINYDATTIDSTLTVADYRQALDDTFALEVTSYGWAKPPICDTNCGNGAPPDNKYPVQIADLGSGLYGYVTTGGDYGGWYSNGGDNPNTPETETDSLTSCMVLNSEYTTNGLGGLPGLQVTAAHEYVHAIQNGYGDPNGQDLLWWESIAAYMEDEVLDSSNDNYQYLWPTWTESLGNWPADNHYAVWILYRYAAEHNGGTNLAGGGEDVIQDIWKGIAAGQWAMVAFNDALVNVSSNLADTFHNYAIASRFLKSCPESGIYCYEEAADYVNYMGGTPDNHDAITTIPDTISTDMLDNYSINWIGLPTSGPYQVTLENTSTSGQLRASIVADPTGDRTGTLDVQALPAVVNAGESTTLCYTPPTGAASVVTVITNQFQAASDPAVANLDTYSFGVDASSPTGSASGLATGVATDIGCGTYINVEVNSGDPGTIDATKNSVTPGSGQLPVVWDISASGSSYDVNLTLCYTDDELANAGTDDPNQCRGLCRTDQNDDELDAAGANVTEAELVMYRKVGTGPWLQVGADSVDTDANCLTKNGVTGFSSWTVGTSDATVPVTLSYIYAERGDDGLITFTWETATETSNLGFNLYMIVDGENVLVNDELIQSSVIDSLEPVGYTYTAEAEGELFSIEMIDTAGESELVGPFNLGTEYGMSELKTTAPTVTEHKIFLPLIVER